MLILVFQSCIWYLFKSMEYNLKGVKAFNIKIFKKLLLLKIMSKYKIKLHTQFILKKINYFIIIRDDNLIYTQ